MKKYTKIPMCMAYPSWNTIPSTAHFNSKIRYELSKPIWRSVCEIRLHVDKAVPSNYFVTTAGWLHKLAPWISVDEQDKESTDTNEGCVSGTHLLATVNRAVGTYRRQVPADTLALTDLR